jgi:hypothetical protein
MARLPRDEIVNAILDVLGGTQRKSLVLPETLVERMRASPNETIRRQATRPQNYIRTAVTTLVGRLAVVSRKGSRKERKAAAKIAQDIDDLIAGLELKLTHSLAPLTDPGLTSRLERLRWVCRLQMCVRPKGGRSADELKRFCATNAFHLMQMFSRRKIVSSRGGAFVEITALLYEVITGKRLANCMRACAWMLGTTRAKKRRAKRR